MNRSPNFPLLFEQIGNYLAKAMWSETQEKQLLDLKVPPDTIRVFRAYMAGQQDNLEAAQAAYDEIVQTMYGGTNAYPCLGTIPRIKPVA